MIELSVMQNKSLLGTADVVTGSYIQEDAKMGQGLIQFRLYQEFIRTELKLPDHAVDRIILRCPCRDEAMGECFYDDMPVIDDSDSFIDPRDLQEEPEEA